MLTDDGTPLRGQLRKAGSAVLLREHANTIVLPAYATDIAAVVLSNSGCFVVHKRQWRYILVQCSLGMGTNLFGDHRRVR